MTATPGSGVELEGLRHAYGGVETLRGVSLSIAPGEFFTLLGASGCGKTTTLRLIAGLLAPAAGRIVVGGRDITGVPTHRREIAVVFQNYALFPHLTVAENVGYGLRARGRAAREIGPAVASALATVGLPGIGARYPAQLSGGQQQRVGLARAIAVRPAVMLLDEPLSNLDARLREQMCVEIADLQRRLGTTLIYVTHDQGEALAVSDRIGVMAEGRIEGIGAPAELYRKPGTAAVAQLLGEVNLVPAGEMGGPAGRTAAIRPEALRVSSGEDGVAARVTRVVYRGATSVVHLEAEGVSVALVATLLGRAPFGAGDAVRVSVDPADLHLLDGAT